MDNWRKTKSFTYTVRATQSVEDISLDEFRTHYFSVGVGDDLTDVPFTDMLLIFDMIAKQCEALDNRQDKSKTDFKISYEISTEFSDEEANRLLSGIRIETPFDKGTHLRIVANPQTPPASEDGPQT